MGGVQPGQRGVAAGGGGKVKSKAQLCKRKAADPDGSAVFWRSGRDSNPRGIAPKLISSVVYHWQIHVWSRSLQAALLRGGNPDAARDCGHSDPFRPELI